MEKENFRIIAYIAGTQGLLTLKELIKNKAILDVVLSHQTDNSEIISICESHKISWSFVDKSHTQYCRDPLVPSLLICSSFPEKIASEKYESLSHGGVNIHASVLPKYRGKNSDVWALINDEKLLGVTVHKLDDRFDNGDILKIYRFAINDEMKNAEIYDIALSFIPDIVKGLLDGELLRSSEPKEGENIYWRKRSLADSKIDWRQTSRQVFLFIRALGRDPIYAYSIKNGKRLQIQEARMTSLKVEAKCGTIVRNEGHFCVVCGDGYLLRLIEFKGTNLLSGDNLA